VAQLDGASGGEVLYEHEGSGEPEIRIMFQDARLLPWKRVQANVALGCPAQPRRSLPSQVGLDQRAGEWPAVLSVASASAWPWRARWCTTRNCCCWTSRWARSMR
jgi:sulfonate transport system ATP-binding protein